MPRTGTIAFEELQIQESLREAKRRSCKKYYERNSEILKIKSRERMKRLRETEATEDRADRLQRQCEAGRRYYQRHKSVVNAKAYMKRPRALAKFEARMKAAEEGSSTGAGGD